MSDLTDFIDPHVHAAPEHLPRLLDDIAIAHQASEANMAGVLIKSHTVPTADRAFIASMLVPGTSVWGGLVLNKAVGGFNPTAVEVAIAYGAQEIWMPTQDATNHCRFYNQMQAGLSLVESHLPDAVHEILKLIADHRLILGTGHLSVAEILTLVPLARQHGVEKILITHPEAPFIDMPVPTQQELTQMGCLFERCWVFTTPALGQVITPARLMFEIRAVGYESTVLATDMGQVGNPSPIEGLRAYVDACLRAGFAEREVQRMGSTHIKEWLT